MWKNVLLAFGPIVGFVGLLFVLKPAEGEEPETSRAPAVPAIPDVPNVPGIHVNKIVISGEKQKIVRRCESNADLIITGVKNDIEIDGECGSVTVSGEKNEIALTQAEKIVVSGLKNKLRVDATGAIIVDGEKNVVRYRRGLIEGKEPRIIHSGRKTEVLRER